MDNTMTLDQVFSNTLLKVVVPDTTLDFPPKISTDDWLEKARSISVERKQAFFGEFILEYHILRCIYQSQMNIYSHYWLYTLRTQTQSLLKTQMNPQTSSLTFWLTSKCQWRRLTSHRTPQQCRRPLARPGCWQPRKQARLQNPIHNALIFTLLFYRQVRHTQCRRQGTRIANTARQKGPY